MIRSKIDTSSVKIFFKKLKILNRSGHGKTSYGNTNIYEWFRLSFNQPYSYPIQTFLLNIDHIGSTLINSTPRKKGSRKFLATFRIKAALEEKQL